MSDRLWYREASDARIVVGGDAGSPVGVSLRAARFIGGPRDGECRALEDEPREVVVAVPFPLSVVDASEWADPIALKFETVRYVKRKYQGRYAHLAPLVYDYDGPSAYAVFQVNGHDPISPQFKDRGEAHDWARDALLRDRWLRLEVRWVYPAPQPVDVSR